MDPLAKQQFSKSKQAIAVSSLSALQITTVQPWQASATRSI
jgi:hypothetical protein